MRLWCRSLRLDLDPASLAAMSQTARPAVFTLWHNRLFIAAECHRRFRSSKRIYALVSASRDGAWLAAFYETVGLATVRGSTSRHGREALLALAAKLREGDDVGITPDGPRGPCYELRSGGVLLARRTGAATIVVGAKFHRAWRVRSWDGFYVPLPFSRVTITCELWDVDTETPGAETAEKLRARLLEFSPDRPSDQGRHPTSTVVRK
jgi:lysophospholipid acyltransferase (LPLAT)-like uncharacterized protein